jgi:uncharacterized membrane protein YphA (DoxX/SURF4 family)
MTAQTIVEASAVAGTVGSPLGAVSLPTGVLQASTLAESLGEPISPFMVALDYALGMAFGVGVVLGIILVWVAVFKVAQLLFAWIEAGNNRNP